MSVHRGQHCEYGGVPVYPGVYRGVYTGRGVPGVQYLPEPACLSPGPASAFALGYAASDAFHAFTFTLLRLRFPITFTFSVSDFRIPPTDRRFPGPNPTTRSDESPLPND